MGVLGVLAVVLMGLIPFVLWLLDRVKEARKARRERLLRSFEFGFPYEVAPVDKLPLKAGVLAATVAKIEPYIERHSLRLTLGADSVPSSRRMLIHGKSGVGKTREAVEVIQRLSSTTKNSSIYFAQREVIPPPSLPTGFPYRNIILFVDDAVTSSTTKGVSDEDEADTERSGFGERLQRTIRFFEDVGGRDGRIDVIMTMLTEEFKHFAREAPDLAKQFVVVEIDAATDSEKQLYVSNLEKIFGVKLDSDEVRNSLVQASRESFGEIYNFFSNLKKKAKAKSIVKISKNLVTT